jgi:hypothetical protein
MMAVVLNWIGDQQPALMGVIGDAVPGLPH